MEAGDWRNVGGVGGVEVRVDEGLVGDGDGRWEMGEPRGGLFRVGRFGVMMMAMSDDDDDDDDDDDHNANVKVKGNIKFCER